ncbi:MAG: hypothetical protein CSA52_00650 [Gammaproteobacteria bacterium]|nr:MAG: hypothetical protein CSB48_06620 [Pseudomonadota bacterium]PIE38911.1 MAG: hypothetical protein CSA52_00650 [Gammaproteobacteria bacterium]
MVELVKRLPMHKNLRFHHRIPADCAVEIECCDGQHFSARAVNISRSGICLECDRRALDIILPKTKVISRKEPVQVRLCLELATDCKSPDKTSTVKVLCNIIHTRRVARDSYHAGLEFCEPGQPGQQHIDDYIKQRS